MFNLGDIIRKSRKAVGLTQAELAGRIGLSTKTIGEYERGDVSPQVQTIQKIEKELGLKILNPGPDLVDKRDMVSKAPKGDKFGDDLLWEMIYIILDSDSDYKKALTANIRAFFSARKAEINNGLLRNKVAELEHRLESVEKKVPP